MICHFQRSPKNGYVTNVKKNSKSPDDVEFRINIETGVIDGLWYFSDYFSNEARNEWAIDKNSLFFRN
jgi:hypothetical protein